MPRYDVFGYTLESDIALPELTPSRGNHAATWRVRTVLDSDPEDRGVLLGTETVYDSVEVRAYASASGFSLAYDDTGTFTVRVHDRLIDWHPGSRATDAAVRADLLGRVLALAAHADGLLALHASAVSIAGRAVAFVGPKHAGKSTLALALVRRGAKLLTDDTLVVRMDDSNTAWAAPGVQRVRLWSDSARALGAESSGPPGAKPTIDSLTSRQIDSLQMPLSACYLLESTDQRGSAAICRERMPSVRAAVACVRFAKLGALAGGVAATAVLDRAVRLTNGGGVPVFAANVRRDLEQLDDVAAAIIAWHEAERGTDAMVPL